MTPYSFDPAITVPTEIVAAGVRSWSFPSSWTPELAETFVTADDEERGETAAIADLEALAIAPARLVEAKVQALAEARALRITMARDLDEDAIYKKALVDHGRARRVRTPEGSIILRPLTTKEVDNIAGRMMADGMSVTDKTLLWRGQIATSAVHPSRPRFDQIVDLYPGIWSALIEARDQLIDGELEDAEKKA
jgi:hypothetical protein